MSLEVKPGVATKFRGKPESREVVHVMEMKPEGGFLVVHRDSGFKVPVVGVCTRPAGKGYMDLESEEVLDVREQEGTLTIETRKGLIMIPPTGDGTFNESRLVRL